MLYSTKVVVEHSYSHLKYFHALRILFLFFHSIAVIIVWVVHRDIDAGSGFLFPFLPLSFQLIIDYIIGKFLHSSNPLV